MATGTLETPIDDGSVPAEAAAAAPRNGAGLHLESGERTDQPTFHAWYKTTPDGFKAELIGGRVVVASPVKNHRHARPHGNVMHWLGAYSVETPGTYILDNPTTILGPDAEPQPDGALVIDPAWGGRTTERGDDYTVGGPEFVVEVANSSGAIDLGEKRADYERAGVQEYVVALLRDRQVRWFINRGGRFDEFPPDPDGLFRSRVFPGLWLDPAALLTDDARGVIAALRRGLASPEHADFVRLMEARRPGG